MAKRSATTDLNHDNWDAKEEREDPGNFTPLSGAELQKRVIRKAKRSLNSSAAGSSPASSSPFAKFSGFSSTAASSPFFSTVNKTNSPFLAATPTTENTPKNPFPISQEKTNNKDNSSFLFSATKKDKEETPNGKSEENMNLKSITQDTKKSTSSSASLSNESTQVKQSRGIEYCKQLKSLNESVLKWIQLHLAKNACSDFTPVFTDYKKHLDSLNMKYPVRKNESATPQQGMDVFKKPSPSTNNNSDSAAQSNFPKEIKKEEDETDYGAHFSSNTTNTSTFSFGIKLTPTATSSNSPLGPNSSSKEGALKNNEENKSSSQFSTGFFSQSNKEENKGTSQFSAGFFSQNNKEEDKSSTKFSAGFFSKALQSSSDKPFSFATAPVEKSGETNKEEEYVPPKNEFVAVAEEDAVYSKRCKLFFKKDDAFADKGVGTLYIKSLEETTQLLIRADTSLGNILLNIRLSASLPISRSGKNNVMIACIPNPPADAKNPDKAIPILIRVKTSEDADELLETLNKYKS